MLASSLLTGSLAAATPLPISLNVIPGDLGTRSLAKGLVGTGYRFIARNGRVLLATHAPLAELIDQIVNVRLQVWHRAILPGDLPEPYGLLVCIRKSDRDLSAELYRAALTAIPTAQCALAIEVGGGRWLEFECHGGTNIRGAAV